MTGGGPEPSGPLRLARNSKRKKGVVRPCRLRAIATCASLWVLPPLAVSAGFGLEDAEAQIPVTESAGYFFRGAEVPLEVHLDSLGVYAPGLSADSLESLLQGPGIPATGPVTRDLGSGLFLVGLDHPIRRDSVVSLAREITASLGPLIRQAGMVVRIPRTEDPSIVTDQFVVEFLPDVTTDEIGAVVDELGGRLVGGLGLLENDFLLEATGESEGDALDLSASYWGHPLVRFAHPDFLTPTRETSWFPGDEFFGDQWHLHNTGQFGGTVDADIDAPEAWDLTKGDPSIVIAVIEPFGFDLSNPDISANLWTNAYETSDGANHDGPDPWVKEDDLHGWNFVDCPTPNPGGPTPTPNEAHLDPCGYSDFSLPGPGTSQKHGTAVAGLAAARAGSVEGVAGVCPFCSLMLIRLGPFATATASSIRYAWQMGADVINNSWYRSLDTDFLEEEIKLAATHGRNGLGTVVVFSTKDKNENNCAGSSEVLASDLEEVVAVSSSTNRDTKASPAGVGPCLDVLAPGFIVGTGGSSNHVPGVVTTDVVGAGGYNSDSPATTCGVAEFTLAQDGVRALDYTRCFSGTSAAAPIVSGVVGLMLSANPHIYRSHVQKILNETADQIDPVQAAYSTTTGHSNTHGFGRVNAFSAVEAALGAGIAVPPLPGPPGPWDKAWVIPMEWVFNYVKGDHHLNLHGVWIDGESYDPEPGEMAWNTSVVFADKNLDDDYWWEVSHGVFAFQGAFATSDESGWIESDGGASTLDGALEDPGLVGLAAATVVLKGWQLDFASSDHHVKAVSVRIRDVDFDPGAGSITWRAEAELRDKNADDDYRWRYQWQVMGFREGEVVHLSRSGTDGGNTDLDESSEVRPELTGFETGLALPQGWRFVYDSRDHEINEHRFGVRNLGYDPEEGRVRWTTTFNYSDKNFDDDYTWEYDIAVVAFNGGARIGWWGGPIRDDGGEAQGSFSVKIRR